MTQHTRWEYLTVEIDIRGFWGPKPNYGEIAAAFNEYGAQGWELVSALDLAGAEGTSSKIVAFFKRPAAAPSGPPPVPF